MPTSTNTVNSNGTSMVNNLITEEQLKSVLPPRMKKSINQQLIDSMVSTINTPDEYEIFAENILGYAHVLSDGKFSMQQYIDAVKYVSYKLMGKTNQDAYIATFPDRYQQHLANGTSSKDIASYITAYNKTKLVNIIYEQTMIPSYVLNQDVYQRAINVQADLMVNARSEMVRTQAANSLLNHLKLPETQKIELDIGVKKDSTIEQLKNTILELSKHQRTAIEAGTMTAQEIAETRLSHEVSDVELE